MASLLVSNFIIQSFTYAYIKRKVRLYFENINKLNPSCLNRESLNNKKQFSMFLNKDFISKINFHCKLNKITKSAYIESLIFNDLTKGGKQNVS